LQSLDGIQIYSFPNDVLTKLKTLTDETLAEEAAKNPKFAEIYQAYEAFRVQNEAWSAISENAYLALEKNQ
jgi:TRAP-type mannitol/chloroaromatic compound transport system substrate-binding protein